MKFFGVPARRSPGGAAGREIATAQDARDLLGITRNCLRDEG